MKHYTIHFTCEETGEDFTTGVFCNKEEAMSHRDYNNGGYGKVELLEITRKEALQILADDIDEEARIRMDEEGVVDADWDEFKEHYFFAEVNRQINNKEPGWELLLEEYGDC